MWWFSDQLVPNQRVFLQPLRTGLKRNQFARDSFARRESKFTICLEGSWIASSSDCLSLFCGYLPPNEIDSARYKSRLDCNDENHESRGSRFACLYWRKSFDHQTRSNSVFSHQTRTPTPKPWEFSWQIQCMAWPLAFLYTQVAIVNNTKLSSPAEVKSPLKLAIIEIEPSLSLQTQSSQQQCTWKDARSETAQNHMPLHSILFTKRVFANGAEPTHVNFSGAECRLRKR